MNEDAITAVRIQLGNAADNLHRARAAARSVDASKPYGQSGKTLQQIVDGYQAEYDRWQQALAAGAGSTRGARRFAVSDKRVYAPHEIETMIDHAYHGLEAGAAERAAVVRDMRALSAEHQRRSDAEARAGNAIQAAREEGASVSLALAANRIERGDHLKPNDTP